MLISRAIPFALAMTATLIFACDSDNGPEGSEGLDEDKSLGMSVSPGTLNVLVGTTGSGRIVVTRGVALVEPIQLSAAGVPAGVTVAFAPEVLSGDVAEAEIMVAVAQTASPGSHEITVRATATATATASRTLMLVVVPPAPALGLTFDPAALTVVAGGSSATTTLNIERVGFTGPVACWSAPMFPNGLDLTLRPERVETATSMTMTVRAPGTMVPGVYEAGALCWASDAGSPVAAEMMRVTVIAAP